MKNLIYIVKRLIRSLKNSCRGIIYAYKNDESFHMEVTAIIILIGFIYLFWPLRSFEILFLIGSYLLILITELINTSIETAWKKIHPKEDILVGISKDISSSAVGLAILFATIVMIIIAISNL